MLGGLAVAFFCSGFSALLCQVVWQRMLGIFAGSDTVSAALVVGAFLMGLGVGSIIGAKLADWLSPIRALVGFAVIEAGVAVFALLSKPFLYDLLAVDLAGTVDSPAAIFALCFAGLVLPTTLMGMSLPLLARAIATSLDTVAGQIGWLYGLNTLGAGAGAIIGGWVLIGSLGFVGALFVAAALNLGAALIALTLIRRLRAAPTHEAAPVASTAPAAFGSLPLWCVLVFVSGYVIVALEILWVRILGQVGQYHAYLFPTVLGAFLLADGAGIAVASRLVSRLRDPRRAFFIVQSGGFVLATALLLGLWVAMSYPPLVHYVQPDNERLYGRTFMAVIVLIAAVVMPPSFLIGMTFPLVQRAVQRDLAAVGSRVGWVQLANIAGNAAGSIGTGLITLHLLGTAETLRLLAALSLALLLGWFLLGGRRALDRTRGWRGSRAEIALAAACLTAVLAIPGNAAFWRRMHAQPPEVAAAWAEDRSGVAFWRDNQRDPARPAGPIFIMGFDQGYIPFVPIHMMLGATGPLLHSDAQRVLAIGVGSGGSPWGLLASPGVRHLRAIELIQPVLTALARVGQLRPNGPIAALLADPRLQLEYGDGRRALARGTDQYDVIEADAILPTASHSGMLYSREYLEQVKKRLAPGGLYVQWTPTERAVETFASAFPHAVLLLPANIMIGSARPLQDVPAILTRRLAEPAVAAHIRRGNPAVGDLAAMIADPPRVWGPDDNRTAAPLTDMFPRDEFFVNNSAKYLLNPPFGVGFGGSD